MPGNNEYAIGHGPTSRGRPCHKWAASIPQHSCCYKTQHAGPQLARKMGNWGTQEGTILAYWTSCEVTCMQRCFRNQKNNSHMQNPVCKTKFIFLMRDKKKRLIFTLLKLYKDCILLQNISRSLSENYSLLNILVYLNFTIYYKIVVRIIYLAFSYIKNTLKLYS